MGGNYALGYCRDCKRRLPSMKRADSLCDGCRKAKRATLARPAKAAKGTKKSSPFDEVAEHLIAAAKIRVRVDRSART
jgi:hypothetical protein